MSHLLHDKNLIIPPGFCVSILHSLNFCVFHNEEEEEFPAQANETHGDVEGHIVNCRISSRGNITEKVGKG